MEQPIDKSFLDRSQAEEFVAGKNPLVPNSAPKPTRYYAVASGNDTGIFTDWKDVEPAITGAKGPKYKKFDDHAKAVEFIEEWGDAAAIRKVKESLKRRPAAASTAAKTKQPAKTAQTSKPRSKDGKLAIYTDGSSRGNGRAGATAGVGVYFGPGDSRNLAEPLDGMPQTNQRAELTAILRALQIVPLTQDVEIFSDSQYSINCITVWYQSWQKREWKTVNGQEIKNLDLVKETRERIDARDEAGSTTALTYVKGHADNVGNIAADSLAVAGAKMDAGRR